MHALKLTQIGNSVGVILPKEVLARLNLVKGDTLFVTNTPDGVALTPYDPNFQTQMTAARNIMRKRRNVLHELAK
jgi:putative addiction module antidote